MIRVVALALLLLLPLPAFAQEDFSRFVETARQRYRVPGASVAVVRGGKVVHLAGYGVRRAGGAAPVGPDTVFQLASVTKTLTAALVATQVDAGRMGWDQPLVEVLPELRLHESYPTMRVTVRDFLSHRSGLPAFTGDLFDRLGYSREEVVRRVAALPLSAGFREKAAYSNVGYFLAGMAAARAAGAGSWEDALRAHVLSPLGLAHTGFPEGRVDASADQAFPHMAPDRPLDVLDSQSVLAPAGLASSSASDMARFLQMLLDEGRFQGRQVLRPESVAALFSPSMVEEPQFSDLPPIGDPSGFAFSQGFAVYYYNGYKVVEKGGARAGVRTVVTMVPELDAGIVVLSNLNLTAFPEAVRARFLEDVAGKARGDVQAELLERQAALDKAFARVGDSSAPAVKAPSSVPLDRYVGRYVSPLYGAMEIRREGGGLSWRMGPSRYGYRLDPVGYTSFEMAEPPGGISIPADVTFVLDAGGTPTSLQTDVYGTFTRTP